MKNGQTKGSTTCKFTRRGEQCPNAGKGCPFSHKKPKPTQPNDAAPATTSSRGGGGDRGRPKGRGKGGDRPRGGGASRSQTPAGERPKGQRTRSQSERAREREKNMVCYPYSRNPANCKGPKAGCYKNHRGLSDAEKLKRDKYEEARLAAGKSLGYERTAAQAQAAAANVAANSSRPRSTSSERRKRDGGKGGGKGKGGSKGKGKGGGKGGKDKPCRVFLETGKCDRGKDCWFRANTPNHP